MNIRKLKFPSQNTIQPILELVFIFGWAVWLGRPYLDFNPNVWPYGGEFAMTLVNHYNWQMLLKCGSCFFWNGFSNGGAPSFVDTHSAWLHPLSMLATFLFGAFNGGKVLLVAGLVMAGIAQWWIGKILKLEMLPRMWGALLAVSGGHIIGRLEATSVPLVLSTASCSLVIPAALNLALNGGKKNAALLGLLTGLALLSGQGYLQIGLAISLPLAIIYLLTESSPDGLTLKPVWKEFVLALCLALLIASPLLIPLIHYSPVIDKPTDPNFDTAQPIRYALLNLLVDNDAFYYSEILERPSLPYLYINYIGWLPVILAAYCIFTAPREMRKLLNSLLIATATLYLISDVTVLKVLSSLPLGKFLAGIRNPPLIQGLAIPLILIFSTLGLQLMIKTAPFTLHFGFSQTGEPDKKYHIQLKWPVLALIVTISLWLGISFAQKWIRTFTPTIDPYPIIEQLKTDQAQWVEPPFGDYLYIPAGMENNIKFNLLFRPWHIIGPDLPLPYLEAVNKSDGTTAPEYWIKALPENQYAYITSGEQTIPCRGKSSGGMIDVTCESTSDGRLFVIERALSGWRATLDGDDIPLYSGPWLSVAAPAGKHEYSFRYRPWDAPLGIGFAFLGLALCVVFILHPAKFQRPI